MRTLAMLVAFLAALLPTRTLIAQPGEEAVAVRAVARETSAKPGERVVVAVELRHAEGFHTWPAAGVDLPASVVGTADRTTITSSPQGAQLEGIQWPTPHPGQVPNLEGAGTITSPLYSGAAVAYLTYRIAPGASGELDIPIAVHYQACDATTCLPPQDVDVSVTIRVSPDAAAGAGSEPELFASYNPAAMGRPPSPPTPVAAPTAEPATRSLFGVQFGGGLLVLFLAAALGGAILNLTPCVLPIIPIKVMTLVQHAGSPRRRVALGLWMALGVVAFWSALAIPVLALKGADPAQLIFGVWWLTLLIGLLIAAMGLGIMGLFSIQLPRAVYAINPKAETASGSFVYGIMAGVLGLPCFGFVAGGLLAGAAALPWEMIVTIFVGLGVGMGAPYLILSAWPALIERLPRTGPASELLKQVMGLLLLAFAAYFVAAGMGGMIKEMPYLTGSLNLWIVAFFVVLTGLWLTIRTLQIARTTWPKVVMPLLALIAAGGMMLLAGRAAATDREDWRRARAAGDDDASIVTGAWLPYTQARFNKALASGNVVVADFTADWCITCKVVKRTILDADPVRSRLQQDDIVLLEVDTTSKTSAGAAFLKTLGRTGVPTLAVYGPALTEPLIYNAYTPDVLLRAIAAAKGQRSAQRGSPSGAE